MVRIKPIYGTTESGTETILSKWLSGSKDAAIKFLMMCISVNKPETLNNTEQMAKDTIEKWIEDTYENQGVVFRPTVNGFAKKPNLKNKSSINNKKMNRDEKFN